jgi:lysine 2,3-aminomutase
MERLADAGIPTGNQSVLLKGINDCPVLMRKLVHELVKVRCRPYYIYNCDLSEGLSHFRTTVAKGIEIIEALRGHTSGYAVPTFVVDAPGGGGKIPVMPQYLISQGSGSVVLRNFEGKITVYHEGTPDDHVVDGQCTICHTDHATVNIGVAAQLSAVRKLAGEIDLPDHVTRIGHGQTTAKPLITPEQLELLEKEAGDD